MAQTLAFFRGASHRDFVVRQKKQPPIGGCLPWRRERDSNFPTDKKAGKNKCNFIPPSPCTIGAFGSPCENEKNQKIRGKGDDKGYNKGYCHAHARVFLCANFRKLLCRFHAAKQNKIADVWLFSASASLSTDLLKTKAHF